MTTTHNNDEQNIKHKFELLTSEKDSASRDQDKDKNDLSNKEIEAEFIEVTRNHFQVGRRLFHCLCGVSIALIYQLFLDHATIVYILGTLTCLYYITEQVRLAYPEFSLKFLFITKFFLRTEEATKEAAGFPYAISIFLIIIAFPRPVAIASILSLAIADPAAAIFGITFGKHKIRRNKTLEGSLAFFICVFLCTLYALLTNLGLSLGPRTLLLFIVAFIVAFVVTGLELIPLRLDDNLCIPLFVAFTLSLVGLIFGLPLW